MTIFSTNKRMNIPLYSNCCFIVRYEKTRSRSIKESDVGSDGSDGDCAASWSWPSGGAATRE
jgi:hypothetical protein